MVEVMKTILTAVTIYGSGFFQVHTAESLLKTVKEIGIDRKIV